MTWANTQQGSARFVELLQAAAATFRVQTDEALFLGYEMALSDVPLADIEVGIRRAMRECQFMPSGAELRNLCGVQSVESRALLAWECVTRSVRSAGAYQSVSFDCPIITATIRLLGGWVALCDTPEGDEFDKWKRKEFERVYAELWRSGVFEDMARPLLGLVEQENAATGWQKETPAPLRIESGLPVDQTKMLGGTSRKRPAMVSQLAGRLGVERDA